VAKALTKLKTWRAAKAYENFTGHVPKQMATRKLDDVDQAGYRMGSVVGVAYEARRDGETAQYFHRFAKKSRPDLVARDDGKQLYITGGSYKVTDRGIEDRKAMPTLFVVNPSKRKAKKGSSMARRRRRRNASGQFLRNPSSSYARRRRRKTSAVTTVRVRSNPARRHRRRRGLSRALPFRVNPVRRVRHRRRRHMGFRRNPIGRGGLSLGAVMGLVAPGVLVGGGAVGAEVVMGYLPIPAAWKTGYVRHLVKGGLGVAGGLIIADVFGMKKLGEYFALGAVAIASHDAFKDMITTQMPGLSFGEYVPGKRLGNQFGDGGFGYASPGMVGQFGEYVPTPASQFG
jgi:hypothetical protein